MLTIKATALTDAQKLIYGRRRIIDVLHKKKRNLNGSLIPTDITAVDVYADTVLCRIDESVIRIDRADLIKNFWEHRTRTPSFFDYKIWNAFNNPKIANGVPVGALDYGDGSIASALETHLGRVPTIATDKDGTKKLYYVNEHSLNCTCYSWQQLDQYSKELEEEFNAYSGIKFKPVCKHVQWLRATISMQAIAFAAKRREQQYNPRLCVYYFDHRRGVLCYRVTHDGVKAKGQWLPVDGWKEKAVYDSSHMPTGACWKTFADALSKEQPYKLIPYSHSVAALMGRTGSK